MREVEGGAQAWAEAETTAPEAIIVDSWLPDLDLAEFLKDFRIHFPDVDVVTASGAVAQESPRGPYRQELLDACAAAEEIWIEAVDRKHTVLNVKFHDQTRVDAQKLMELVSGTRVVSTPMGVLRLPVDAGPTPAAMLDFIEGALIRPLE